MRALQIFQHAKPMPYFLLGSIANRALDGGKLPWRGCAYGDQENNIGFFESEGLNVTRAVHDRSKNFGIRDIHLKSQKMSQFSQFALFRADELEAL